MGKAGNILGSAARGCASVLLLGAVAFNFANVLARYLFNSPIEWGEEVLLFAMVAMVFLGSVNVSWRGDQIAMDLIVLWLPRRMREYVRLASLFVEMCVAVFIVALCTPVVCQLWAFDQRSQAANIPLAIPQAAIPIGFFLMAIVTALRLVLRNRGPQNEDGKVEEVA